MIGSAYNLAIEQKLVNRIRHRAVRLAKVEHREMKTLTSDQLGAFFQEARDSGVYELYYLDLATGLRRGELLGLKLTDVDLDRGVLKIQRAISRQNGKVVEAPLKTKNAYRTLPLSADAISVLKMQKCKVGNSEWVFPSPTGGPMSPDSVLHMLQRVLKRAGLPRIRFHDLRHPYVKHTTKIFILRLKVLQAQRDPDRRRKTCGAFSASSERTHINQKTGQCGCQPIDTENCFYCLLLTVLPLLFILLLFHLCQYCGIRIFCFQKQFITRGFFSVRNIACSSPAALTFRLWQRLVSSAWE